MSKILLTGSSGFLGQYLYNFFSHNFNIYTLNRFSGDIKCDLSSFVPQFIDNFDIVMHCSGLAHVFDVSAITNNSFNKINVVGTANLLRGLEQINPPKHFVYISSVSVYGLSQGINISENEPLDAKDAYGKSKIEAEEIVIKWCNQHNIICTILRLPLVVGFNPPGNLGAMINGINRGFYFNIGGGIARKSMVLADDIAKFILPAAKVGGIFNLTDGMHPTFYDLSQFIAFQVGKKKVLNIPLFVAKIMARLGDLFGSKSPINSHKLKKITSTLTFDDHRARSSFGWNPTPVLEGFKLI